MIFPFFRQLFEARYYPITWLLLAINLALFLVLTPEYYSNQEAMEELVNDDYFLQAQAQIFARMILAEPHHHAEALQSLAKDVASGKEDATQVLGRLSLRNAQFMNEAQVFPFQGDRVLHRQWLASFAKLSLLREAHPNFSLGLSSTIAGWSSYISYQFVHGGMAHLLINMVVLLLVGSVLEPIVGGAAILALYLICGMGAAVGFLWMSGSTPVPLVGASGSIMGLLGVLAGLRGREPLRFIWFLPTPKYMGYTWLPVWLFVVYLLMSDLAGLVQTASWVGTGVAHAAHLGGAVFGFALGLVLKRFWSEAKPSDQLLFELADPRL